ncbi:MAG TPA: hypothetical protein K8W04_14515 [Bacteroides reticulotermitis]|nr:hypothetical protein [Bacteroides reticulotermitis]
MIKDTFFSLPRFVNLCRKEMVESWKTNLLRIVLLYGLMAVIMLWNGYFEYKWDHSSSSDPMWTFLLGLFAWFLWGGGCLSASFTMEKLKTKTSRISVLMTPATPFEKFFARWFVFTVVFLVVLLITYKMADYTRVVVYSLAYPGKSFITPVDLSHMVGDSDFYTLCENNWQFGAFVAGYFFVQSLFVLGSTIWPKNSFLKTFAACALIVVVYTSVGAFLGKMFFQGKGYYNLWGNWTEENIFYLLIIGCTLFTIVNWTIAYFRFKESEIINRM